MDMTDNMDYTRTTPDGMATVFWSGNFACIRNFVLTVLPVMIIVVAFLFLVAAITLARHGNRKASPGVDYLIVLGAHVNRTVPSKQTL